MTKILVVDDDADNAALLETYLTGEGFEVTVAADGASALAATSPTQPDLVLLDIVPGRRGRPRRPARDAPVERRAGDLPHRSGPRVRANRRAEARRRRLHRQALLTWPRSPRASSRCCAARGPTWPSTRSTHPTMRFGDLLINENTHEVRLTASWSSSPPRSSPCWPSSRRSPRQVFSREQLLEHVWESSSEWQNAGDGDRARPAPARQDRDDPDHPRWITTVRGVGYRFESEPAPLVADGVRRGAPGARAPCRSARWA